MNKRMLRSVLEIGYKSGIPEEVISEALSAVSAEGCWFCGQPKDEKLLPENYSGKVVLTIANNRPCESCSNAMTSGLVMMVVTSEEDDFWLDAVEKNIGLANVLDNCGIMVAANPDDFGFDTMKTELIKTIGWFVVTKSSFDNDEVMQELVKTYGNCFNGILPKPPRDISMMVNGLAELGSLRNRLGGLS